MFFNEFLREEFERRRPLRSSRSNGRRYSRYLNEGDDGFEQIKKNAIKTVQDVKEIYVDHLKRMLKGFESDSIDHIRTELPTSNNGKPYEWSDMIKILLCNSVLNKLTNPNYDDYKKTIQIQNSEWADLAIKFDGQDELNEVKKKLQIEKLLSGK